MMMERNKEGVLVVHQEGAIGCSDRACWWIPLMMMERNNEGVLVVHQEGAIGCSVRVCWWIPLMTWMVRARNREGVLVVHQKDVFVVHQEGVRLIVPLMTGRAS